MIKTNNKSIDYNGTGNIVKIPPDWSIIKYEILVIQPVKIRYWSLVAKINLASAIWKDNTNANN